MMINVNKFTQKNLTKPMLENSFVILLKIRIIWLWLKFRKTGPLYL